jgi:hypothetical protein
MPKIIRHYCNKCQNKPILRLLGKLRLVLMMPKSKWPDSKTDMNAPDVTNSLFTIYNKT